jgi:NAD-dependent dihydropyrimidine dehydrogenase PreA subunit
VVFSSDDEYTDVSNDVLNEQEKDDRWFLKPSGVEFDECVSCDASVSACEMQSVEQSRSCRSS